MGLFSWIIFGLLAGILAKWLMPGKNGGGFFMTIFLGIAGALVGGYISAFFNLGTVNDFSLKSLLIAVLGAILLLFLYRKLKN